MARRPYGSNPSSRFRGPLMGAERAGPAAGAGATTLTQWYGRTRVMHNPFLADYNIATTAPISLVVHPIGSPSGHAVSITSAAVPYRGLPNAQFTGGTVASTGAQWTQGVVDQGIGSSLASATARAYDPETVISFVTELSMTATNLATGTVAIGFINCHLTDRVLTTAGAVSAAADGFFFRIPSTGVMECVWASAGALVTTPANFTYVTSDTNPVAIRLGVRFAVNGLTLSATPSLSGTSNATYYINDTLVATHSVASTGTPLLPLSMNPGIAVVNGGTQKTVHVPYWTMSMGPMRAGSGSGT